MNGGSHITSAGTAAAMLASSSIVTRNRYLINGDEESVPHSLRPDFSPMSRSGLQPVDSCFKNNFHRTDEKLTWNIELPGVPVEEVKVEIVEEKLRVTAPFKGTQIPIEIILAPKDSLSSAVLERGILCITLNRNLNIEKIDVQEL